MLYFSSASKTKPFIFIFLQELDLEQKIDLEIKMREGSAKLLAACNNPKTISKGSNLNSSSSSTSAHSTQILEAAKNLLTSNERMTAYMAELQRRKRDRDTIARFELFFFCFLLNEMCLD